MCCLCLAQPTERAWLTISLFFRSCRRDVPPNLGNNQEPCGDAFPLASYTKGLGLLWEVFQIQTPVLNDGYFFDTRFFAFDKMWDLGSVQLSSRRVSAFDEFRHRGRSHSKVMAKQSKKFRLIPRRGQSFFRCRISSGR